jgi:hypothetical protein
MGRNPTHPTVFRKSAEVPDRKSSETLFVQRVKKSVDENASSPTFL